MRRIRKIATYTKKIETTLKEEEKEDEDVDAWQNRNGKKKKKRRVSLFKYE